MHLLIGRQAFYGQQIFLPGMPGTVGVEQLHPTGRNSRVQVVAKEVFPIFQPISDNNSRIEKLAISDNTDEATKRFVGQS